MNGRAACSKTSSRHKPRVRSERPFDPSKYSTRLIALKIAYIGKAYKGFAHNAGPDSTALPTVERALWRALRRAKLINPTTGDAKDGKEEREVNWEGCEYSKCGRTDKGVSAFGQVIALRMRSNRPRPKNVKPSEDLETSVEGDELEPLSEEMNVKNVPAEPQIEPDSDGLSSFDPIADELPYPQILNRLLPDDIRVFLLTDAPGT